MKLEDLKDWDKLTKEEQDRLKKVYGENPDITKTLANKPPETEGVTNITLNADTVVVNENPEKEDNG